MFKYYDIQFQSIINILRYSTYIFIFVVPTSFYPIVKYQFFNRGIAQRSKLLNVVSLIYILFTQK